MGVLQLKRRIYMKKLLTGLFVLGALVFAANNVFACDNCTNETANKVNCECPKNCDCGCQKPCDENCTCGCQKGEECTCPKDCTCGCKKDEECNCAKDCDCVKTDAPKCNCEKQKCDCKSKKFRLFRRNKCDCNSK